MQRPPSAQAGTGSSAAESWLRLSSHSPHRAVAYPVQSGGSRCTHVSAPPIHRDFRADTREYDQELSSAVAVGELSTLRNAHEHCDRSQHGVSRIVAEAVVEPREVIDIDHQAAHGLVGGRASGQ